MITFKQYLTEEDHVDLIAFLRKNCMQACQDIAVTGKFLYRGMGNASGHKEYAVGGRIIGGLVKTPRNNRAPRDTPAWAHKEIDDYFDMKFGVKLRSNSTFAYTHEKQASGYGDLHIIIPFGKYDIYWSEKVSDLTTHLFPGMIGSMSGHVGYNEKAVYDDEPVTARRELDNLLYKADYKKGPNTDALKNVRSELMVVCERYLALDTNANKSSPNMLDIIDKVVE